eukprot:jgi/Botrbrau1/6157/Bobra.331_2s0047.1
MEVTPKETEIQRGIALGKPNLAFQLYQGAILILQIGLAIGIYAVALISLYNIHPHKVNLGSIVFPDIDVPCGLWSVSKANPPTFLCQNIFLASLVTYEVASLAALFALLEDIESKGVLYRLGPDTSFGQRFARGALLAIRILSVGLALPWIVLLLIGILGIALYLLAGLIAIAAVGGVLFLIFWALSFLLSCISCRCPPAPRCSCQCLPVSFRNGFSSVVAPVAAKVGAALSSAAAVVGRVRVTWGAFLGLLLSGGGLAVWSYVADQSRIFSQGQVHNPGATGAMVLLIILMCVSMAPMFVHFLILNCYMVHRSLREPRKVPEAAPMEVPAETC